MREVRDDKNWMRNLAIATAATVIGGIILLFFTDWWKGSPTASPAGTENSNNITVVSDPDIKPPAPPTVLTKSEQAARLIGGAWRGAGEDCPYARHIIVKDGAVEYRLHGEPVQSPLKLGAVEDDSVTATGERGTVTFTVAGNRMTYRSSKHIFEMEKCP
jgi:hypothetical protein